jgi:hypothetical protein
MSSESCGIKAQLAGQRNCEANITVVAYYLHVDDPTMVGGFDVYGSDTAVTVVEMDSCCHRCKLCMRSAKCVNRGVTVHSAEYLHTV